MDDVRLPEIDAKQLEESLREDMERCIAAVAEAVNRARVEGPSRLYVGADGVKVPMIAAEEKAKRRARCGRKGRGGARRRMHRGADNPYKEFKIAMLDRIAHALNHRLGIHFVPQDEPCAASK
jgi:hypothetical protein